MTLDEQERIKEQIRTMQHYANGGKVELLDKSYNQGWQLAPQPAWNWAAFNYRIKKGPREFKMWVHKFENRHMNWYPSDPTELANWSLITVVEKL